MIDIITYIVDLLGVALVVTLFLLLLIKGVKTTEDKLLLTAFSTIVVMVFIEFFSSDHFIWDGLVRIIELSFGPLLILYIQRLGGDKRLIPNAVYFLPPALIAGFLLYALLNGFSEYEFYASPFYMVTEFIVLISILTYAIVAVLHIQRVRWSNKDVEQRVINWMYVLVFCFFGEIFIELIYLFIYTVSDGSELLWLTDSLISIGLICILLIKGIQYKVLVNPSEESIEDLESRWFTLFKEIDRRVKEEGLYLQSELRINDLAKELSTNSKYISKAVNLGSGESVTNYLNMVRLERFKELVKDQSKSHINIYALAEECGFSSKSSFNRFFKLREGVTPSEYRQGVI